MKNISLCKVKEDDLEAFKRLYESYGNLMLYSVADEPLDCENTPWVTEIVLERLKHEYEKKLLRATKISYFIKFEDEICGYVSACKVHSNVIKIEDLVIIHQELKTSDTVTQITNELIARYPKIKRIDIYAVFDKNTKGILLDAGFVCDTSYGVYLLLSS